ncbi:hypothetical protein [Halopiger xanaduensis]|uniref:Uncharacterized protein n=1 Tax=Halopiger xanaduensis (strain DSM 18323 / JCM 14033 / SH-6) TaxID=797210 RepID=F8DAS2_HALXS|nr:hypothetical protein [Halopiger xanaduensis]AEH37014.1 hypothetical protein Halxa_2395 [Halopiger xanaduensis SH-6]
MSDNANDVRTMAGVSHTNPYTGETSGRLFSRGPTVAADGGRPADAEAAPDEEPDNRDATMADVDHTPPHDADDANRVFERGKQNPVEDEE